MTIDAERNTAEKYLDDATITTKIKAKLAADDLMSAFSIKVETNECVVTLSGDISTEEAKSHAVDIAKHIAGVKEVVDSGLVVKE